MKRLIYDQLIAWKNRSNRKPLIMQGARQVGKTYILKEFGENEYSDLAYFNFEENEELSELFENSLNASEILESLGLYRGRKIDPSSTLVFFDEIQAADRVITSLKYFCEEVPEVHVVSAGSLLGVSVGKQTGFPVGKVNFLDLYPLNFLEYLLATENELLFKYLIEKCDYQPIPEAVHSKLLSHYKRFLFLGGMPEVVAQYIREKDVEESRHIQNEILTAYEQDFSKYANASEAIRISDVWNSIPTHLSRENKKFKYRDVSKGGRATKYETAIEWLRKAGLIHVSYQVKTPKLPLSGYYQKDKFKIFLCDTGLLGAKLALPSKTIVSKDQLFSEYNGAFIENFVATELVSNSYPQLSYWTSKSDAEVDFLITLDNEILPLEVKSGFNKRIKSLRAYSNKYEPSKIIRTSPRNFTADNDFRNIPLYSVFLAGKIKG